MERLFEIVDARLSAGQAYADLSVEELITDVPVARSTFYAYFDGKSALLLALGEHAFGQLQGTADLWWKSPAPADRDTLAGPLLDIAYLYRRRARLWRSVVAASAYDSRVRLWYSQVVEAAASDLQEHITAGQQAGVVRATLDPESTARWLTWMIERGLDAILAETTDSETSRHAAALADIIWSAVYRN